MPRLNITTTTQPKLADPVFYRDADAPRVIHKVAAMNATHFIGVGVSNVRSDGWQPRKNISEVMVGVIYAGGAP
jgi:hypothetical protein